MLCTSLFHSRSSISNEHPILQVCASQTLLLSRGYPAIASVSSSWVVTPLPRIVGIESVVLIRQDCWVVQALLMVACRIERAFIPSNLHDVAIVCVGVILSLVAAGKLSVLATSVTGRAACWFCHAHQCTSLVAWSPWVTWANHLTRLEICLGSVACRDSLLSLSDLVALLASSVPHVAL